MFAHTFSRLTYVSVELGVGLHKIPQARLDPRKNQNATMAEEMTRMRVVSSLPFAHVYVRSPLGQRDLAAAIGW